MKVIRLIHRSGVNLNQEAATAGPHHLLNEPLHLTKACLALSMSLSFISIADQSNKIFDQTRV